MKDFQGLVINIYYIFKEMGADYLLIDDKMAAIYCKKDSLPYINTPLVPHYLREDVRP